MYKFSQNFFKVLLFINTGCVLPSHNPFPILIRNYKKQSKCHYRFGQRWFKLTNDYRDINMSWMRSIHIGEKWRALGVVVKFGWNIFCSFQLIEKKLDGLDGYDILFKSKYNGKEDWKMKLLTVSNEMKKLS